MKKLFFALAALCGLLAIGCPDPGTSPTPVDPTANFTGLSADGSPTQTTTKLSLSFDQDIPGLAVENITLNPGSTGATAQSLNKPGPGTYELTLSGIVDSGAVTVSVSKSGYNITGGPKQVMVYFYNSSGGPLTQAAFTGLSADGSSAQTTTKLSLTFDKDINGLTAGNIALEGSTGATAETLTKTGTGKYDLALSGINQSGPVTVTVAKSSYTITGSPKTAQVFYYHTPADPTIALTITFAQIADSAPSITGPTLYRITNSGPTTAALTVENPDQYTSISWQVQDTAVTGTGASFTLSAANAAYNQIAEHFVTVTVMKGTVPYNKTVSFKVEL